MRLILMRHCEATHNLQHVCSDDPSEEILLTERGIRQATRIAQRLNQFPVRAVYTSDFPRAQQTAAIVNGPHGAPVLVDKRLSEWKTGGFNGKSSADFRAACRSASTSFPGGESFDDIRRRVRMFLDDLPAHDGAVLVVTHHEPLRALLEEITGTPSAKFMPGRVLSYRIGMQISETSPLGMDGGGIGASAPRR